MVLTATLPASYRPLPPPSPLTFPAAKLPDAPPSFAVKLILGVRRLLLRLADRLTPAELALWDHSTGMASTALLGAVARYGIADLLEERGEATAEEIAGKLELDADAVHRTLRALANMGIFTMSHEGRFSNNRISRGLRSGSVSRSREWVLYFSSASNANAWIDYAHTLKSGKSAFVNLHGASVWTWFDQHPDEREMFAHAMMGLTTMDGPAIAAAYPFREIKTLCDVGGGRGTLLSEILVRHPHLHGVLCEGEGVIASAKELLQSRGVLERCELAAGDFFEAVHPGAEAYLMKTVLHDWDDARSLKILSVVRKAMKPGGRLLLCEMLLEKTSRDWVGTRVDLQMMVVCDEGRERSLEEYQALLAKSGFRYTRLFPTVTLAVIEAEAV
jgi:DNA-binding transcriptional ArsR family regulator